MQLNPLQLKLNNKVSCAYGSNNINHTQQKSDVGSSKCQNSNVLYYGLGALAIIVAGGLLCQKFNTLHRDNKAIIANLTIKNAIDILAEKLPEAQKYKLKEKVEKTHIPEFDIFNFVKDNDTKSYFKYILAAKETELNKFIQMPKCIILDNVSFSQKVGKIFTHALGSNFLSTKYTKGHMAEFIESLNEFSSNALKKFDEEQTHTFLHFDNASEFLTDLKLKENEQFKTKFDKIIAKNQENKIVYILDDHAAKQVHVDSILKLEFDEKVNSADLTKDLEEVEFQIGNKLLSKVESITKELSEYIKPNGSPVFYTIRNLLLGNPAEKAFLVDSKDKDIVEKAITLISLKTNNTYEKLDCKEISDLTAMFTQRGEIAEELYNRTGKRTFFYLDNIELSPQVNDFITTASEKYHVIPILNSQKNETIPNLKIPKNQIFKMDFWDKGQKALVDSLELMNERAKKNDFSHINLERLKTEFFALIAAERSGMNPKISNGILLHGPHELTRITADAIKNTVDANYVKVVFNKNKYSDIIDKMIDEAEKAEKQAQVTRKRTILELDGLDNLLALDRSVPENSDLINEFKSIAEDLSQKYHTTIIMRTDIPLDKLDAASIASNRLGMHIEVK